MQHKRLQRSKNGFTLLEVLVVTTIVVMLLLSVSSLFMTFLLSGARTNLVRQIKAEGGEVIDRLEFNVRSARRVADSSGNTINCTPNGSTTTITSGTTLNIIDVTNTSIPISYDGSRILLNNQALNSTFVAPSAPVITCFRDATTQKLTIRITFTLSQTNTTIRQDFTSFVQLRNS